MDREQQADLLNWRGRGYANQLNEQKTDNVEWARHSHNPVTGCLHNCPYCYAREIAEHIYEEKFEPVLHLDRLIAPYTTRVPTRAAEDMSYKNVFMCPLRADGAEARFDYHISHICGRLAPLRRFLLKTQEMETRSIFARIAVTNGRT